MGSEANPGNAAAAAAVAGPPHRSVVALAASQCPPFDKDVEAAGDKKIAENYDWRCEHIPSIAMSA